MKKNKEKKEETLLHFWVTTIISALVVFLAVWGIKSLLIANDKVSGPSMQPTFEDKDRIIAIRTIDAKRNDVVILNAPDQPGAQYIKRVIGMPGDTVESKNDKMYINGKKISESYLDNKYKEQSHAEGYTYTTNFSLSSLAEGSYYKSIYADNKKLLNKVKKTGKVPSGYYFVMGDHRNVSKDSRMIGFIKKDEIVGVVKWRYWPLNEMKTF
ncbi:signal peptidase I [Companilactobacillus sp. RD055328]|uniref:signal peptidase I n=1 Tax=Companilactobacillus sp. RD055328 TaxID=2916634 RepID=UPI001FC8127F|nr:signal peptidase I [Companilactobacillus sp. RD055328]GKQ42671.1 signal peptidase I [Companilactobacillus sp. RD055328]